MNFIPLHDKKNAHAINPKRAGKGIPLLEIPAFNNWQTYIYTQFTDIFVNVLTQIFVPGRNWLYDLRLRRQHFQLSQEALQKENFNTYLGVVFNTYLEK